MRSANASRTNSAKSKTPVRIESQTGVTWLFGVSGTAVVDQRGYQDRITSWVR